MRLLFINALKGLKKKKIQMFGIVVMVMLSTAVYVGMNSAIDRLENKYYDYLEEQNVENFSFAVNIDYKKDISTADLDYFMQHQFKNITSDEKALINAYRVYLKNPVANLKMETLVQMLFQKYEADLYIGQRKLSPLLKKYDFIYEIEKSKTIQNSNEMIKVMPYSDNNIINKTYLEKGRYPKNEGEITILPGYAKNNNVKIGDKYTINDKEYKVVGFTFAPDYIYPMISFSMPVFDENKNNIVFMYEKDYENTNGILDNSYALKFNYKTDRKFEMSDMNLNGDSDYKMFNTEKETVMMDANTIVRLSRISALQSEFSSDRLFAQYFMYLLLGISVLIIVVITKKRIEDERLQIGVLKSLGYNRFSIATSYLVYPIIGSIIGGTIGYFIGVLVHYPISNLLLSYYCVPLDGYKLNLEYLRTSILVPMILLSTLSYLIALFMLRKKPLQLLREGSNLKVNLFSKLVNKLTKHLPFNYRFKYSLAFRSLGKLFIVSITAFCTGLLITLVLVGSNLFSNAIEKSFEGISYKYMVAFKTIEPKESKHYKDTDYSLMVNIPLMKITDSEGKDKAISSKNKEMSFSINGYDENPNYLKLLDKDKKDITYMLDSKKGIIVNKNAQNVFGLELGDTLTFKFEETTVKYKIIGFNSEFMGMSAYANRSDLSRKLGFEYDIYEVIYSNDKKYSDFSSLDKKEAENIYMILSMNDLKANIEKQMDRFNGSIYIVIVFASIMTLIIIAVIANIVVEENKKTISLLKVMGYKNKRISNIVLNIYTPAIIIAYLISIPVMMNILKAIINAITGDIKISIPIEISPYMAGLGLLGLLIAYYVAIGLSKRVLNKIPLAVALKRE